MGTERGIVEFTHKTTLNDFNYGLVKYIKNVFLGEVGITLAAISTGADRVILGYVRECAAAYGLVF